MIIASLPNFGEITAAWFTLGGVDFNGFVSGSTITADFNTFTLTNGVYDLKATACTETACHSNSIKISIENNLIAEAPVQGQIPFPDINGLTPPALDANDSLPAPEEILPDGNGFAPQAEPPPEPEYSIIPSNVPVALSIFDDAGNLIDSSTEEVKAKKGKFSARLTFLEGTIESISMEGLEIDSNALLVEIDEEIPLEMPAPAGIVWEKIVAVNPKARFASGSISLKVPAGAEYFYKCAGWDFAAKSCNGSWKFISDTANLQDVQLEFSASDPGFGFGKAASPAVTFGRLIECEKCGQHKVSPKTNVGMTITANASQEIQNAVLEEFFSTEWQIVDPQGGIVSDVNSEFKKISWNIGTFTGEVSRSYQIFSPERTTPPTDYYFFSSIAGHSSDYWAVKVADPATDVNLTVENCTGGTTINSCPGMNTLGTAQDVINNKSTNFNAGMNNGAYTDSINSVTFWANHSGASGIDGSVAYTLEDSAGTDYCAQDTSILNTTSFQLDSDAGCTPTGGWTAAKLNDLNVLIRNTDGGQGQAAYYDYITVTVNYNPNGTLSFTISNPPSDNNTSVNNNTNFLVNGSTTCNTDDCGSVDTNLQYCIGAGCSSWMDVNSDAGSPLLLVSGSQPQNSASLTAGNSYNVSWVLKSTVAQTYELRFSGTGTTADSGTSSGTDRTITTQAVAADYSFTLSLPSSGCIQGEGSLDASADCEKGYFETTDLAGLADETKVDAQGQTSAVYFFVYDNQSTNSDDLNITLDLNAALPASLELKASQVYGGWEASCSGVPETGCIDVTTTATSVGTATYSAGSQDLNIFLWADFIAAAVGSEDRNVLSTGVSPT